MADKGGGGNLKGRRRRDPSGLSPSLSPQDILPQLRALAYRVFHFSKCITLIFSMAIQGEIKFTLAESVWNLLDPTVVERGSQ